jgi:PsbP-like protein
MTISVSLVYPLQSTNAQTFNSSSTRANATTLETQLQWAVYANDKFGFSVEYPLSWIISEKENRFESGADLTIESPEIGTPDYGQFTFVGPTPSPTNNIIVLTNLGIKETIGAYDIDYERRLIEDANMTKYEIDGEKAGAFTYVMDSTEFIDGETITTPVTAIEFVTTIHDGKSYFFSFLAGTGNFDNPTLTQIREHMFGSIKWLN